MKTIIFAVAVLMAATSVQADKPVICNDKDRDGFETAISKRQFNQSRAAYATAQSFDTSLNIKNNDKSLYVKVYRETGPDNALQPTEVYSYLTNRGDFHVTAEGSFKKIERPKVAQVMYEDIERPLNILEARIERIKKDYASRRTLMTPVWYDINSFLHDREVSNSVLEETQKILEIQIEFINTARRILYDIYYACETEQQRTKLQLEYGARLTSTNNDGASAQREYWRREYRGLNKNR
jgi:hypothetical protein